MPVPPGSYSTSNFAGAAFVPVSLTSWVLASFNVYVWKTHESLPESAQVQRWLPWKVGLLLVGATLLVNAGGMYWWGRQQAAARQEFQSMQRLAQRLDQHVVGTLYSQLSKAQQRELDAIYKEAGFVPVGSRRP